MVRNDGFFLSWYHFVNICIWNFEGKNRLLQKCYELDLLLSFHHLNPFNYSQSDRKLPFAAITLLQNFKNFYICRTQIWSRFRHETHDGSILEIASQSRKFIGNYHHNVWIFRHYFGQTLQRWLLLLWWLSKLINDCYWNWLYELGRQLDPKKNECIEHF